MIQEQLEKGRKLNIQIRELEKFIQALNNPYENYITTVSFDDAGKQTEYCLPLGKRTMNTMIRNALCCELEDLKSEFKEL